MRAVPALDFPPDQAAAISPILFADGKDPATLIVHGDADELVNISSGQAMYDALKKAGAKTEFVVIKGGDHGFRDAADYYARSSSIGFLSRIKRPTLLLSAHDDPFYSRDVLRDVEEIAASNPFVTTEFHERGGHVGFVGGAPWRPTYYVESRVGSFLENYLGSTDSTG